MARRVSFSREHVGLSEIAEHHLDLESSLRLYFSDLSPKFAVRFLGYAPSEVVEELTDRLNENDLSSSLVTLSSIEAAFRIDYLQRCYRRGKDSLSRRFREIYKTKGYQARLDDDILQT
jgi:hypothetical protein